MSLFNPIDFGARVPGVPGLMATGTDQTTAYLLTRKASVFLVVPAGAGAALPASYAAGTELYVFNRGQNALLLYPASEDQIESNGVGVPITIAVGGSVVIVSFDPPAAPSPRTWWILQQTE